MTAVDLSTTVAGMALPNPVMTAAGCAGTGRELAPFLDVAELGAVVTRTITLDPQTGSPPPRVAETPSGMLNHVGLHSPGVDGFLATELPWLAQRRARAVVSIAGATLGEYAELSRRVGNSPGVLAVEVNLAWSDQSGTTDAYHAGKVLNVVRRDVPRGVAVLAKLPPRTVGLVDLARAAAKAGADGVVMVNTLPGMAIDPVTLRPTLGGVTGGLSGPAIHPLAVRCVWEVHQAVPDLPIVGVGGVRTGYDALELLLAGASAVQVGTAVLHDPSALTRIIAELTQELAQRDISSVADVIGLAHRDEGEPT